MKCLPINKYEMTIFRMQPIPVFVISLKRSPERRAAISSHLDRLGIEYTVVDAVDGKDLDPDYVKSLSQGHPIHLGAVGCYLSHISIYERLVQENIPVALVLEDDAILRPKVMDLLRQGCRNLDFDYCFLDSDDRGESGSIFYDASDKNEIAQGFWAYGLSGGPHCTHAYLITLPAAKRRIEYAYPIVKPIDCYEHLPYQPRFLYIVKPKLAGVSQWSLESFTSARNMLADGIKFRSLRRVPGFYPIRDMLNMKSLKRHMELRGLIQQGKISADKRWRPIPSGREVLQIV